MAVWILAGETDSGRPAACLVDSVSETAFGTVFSSARCAHAFLDWLARCDGRDPRALTEPEYAVCRMAFTASPQARLRGNSPASGW